MEVDGCVCRCRAQRVDMGGAGEGREHFKQTQICSHAVQMGPKLKMLRTGSTLKAKVV